LLYAQAIAAASVATAAAASAAGSSETQATKRRHASCALDFKSCERWLELFGRTYAKSGALSDVVLASAVHELGAATTDAIQSQVGAAPSP